MVWINPVDPVPGTVITVAAYVASALDNIRWLRVLHGNSDPPGSSFIVASTSPTATAWQKVTTDLIADGAVTTSKLTYTPVNRAGDSMTASLTFVNPSTGIGLGLGSSLTDIPSPTRLVMVLAGDRLDLYNQAVTAQLLQVDGSVFRYRGVDVSLTGHTHGYILATNGQFHGDLTGLDPGSGLVLAGASAMREFPGPTRLALICAGGQLSVYDSNLANEMLRITNSVFQYKGTDVSLTTHNHNLLYLPITSPHFRGDVTGLDAGAGLVLNGNSALREFTGPARLALICQGSRLDVYDSSVSNTLMQLDNATFQYKGQNVIHSGNISSQTVAFAGNATTANNANGISDGAVSTTAKLANSVVTDAKVAPANKDGVAATASMRTLGPSAQQAAAGNHAHFANTTVSTGNYSGNGAGLRTITSSLVIPPKIVHFQLSSSGYTVNRGYAFMSSVGKVTIMPTGAAIADGNDGTLSPNGFSVPASLNVSGVTYDWVSFG
jgi:hypothetical protein